MTYPTDYCPDCGVPSPNDPCDICAEVMVYLTLPDPSDKELEEMAFYYDEIEAEARADAYHDMDHDYDPNNYA